MKGGRSLAGKSNCCRKKVAEYFPKLVASVRDLSEKLAAHPLQSQPFPIRQVLTIGDDGRDVSLNPRLVARRDGDVDEGAARQGEEPNH